MSVQKITDDVSFININDYDTDLFEGQYAVPNGISYNSYIIADEKTAILDTADASKTDEYLSAVENALNGAQPYYLILNHLEPDHSGALSAIISKYPDMKLVGNAKTFSMLEKFTDCEFLEKKVVVTEGESLCLGKHTLNFYMAPMVHWPEVMVTYDSYDKILFSADAFGTFGTPERGVEWLSEARRYYINIVGKFGAPVQALLKKAETLDIQLICPLHGPILKENLGYYIDKYKTWSSYTPETDGVFVCYASLHKHTAAAAKHFAEILKEKGTDVFVADLARDDMSACVAKAFEYSRTVFAASSYNGGVMPFMEDFLNHLKAKNFQKRTVGLIENGSWAPSAAKTMRNILETMKDIQIVEPTVTLGVKTDAAAEQAMCSLSENIIKQ